jgi:hypothetical protein
LADFIDQPERLSIDGQICYRFVFAVIIWVFFVFPGNRGGRSVNFFQEDGALRIPCKRVEDLGFLHGYAFNFKSMGRLPKPGKL